MIDAGDTVLRRKGESGRNVSNNPLPEHKSTVGAITTYKEFEDSIQYIVDETELMGIVEKSFILKEDLVEEIKLDLFQVFIGVTYEDGSLNNVEFSTIPEGAIQNWATDDLPSGRGFR